MLRICHVLMQLTHGLRGTLGQLARNDPDLARQCRRALWSVIQNTSERSGSRGRNRPARYHDALGSAREALACPGTAEAFGYLKPLAPAERAQFNHVIGTPGLG